ncbi:MAG: hypothetical protein ACOY31_10665 [Bacillota bacterium]
MTNLNVGYQFKKKRKLEKISVMVSCVVFAASILLFWLGLDFLKVEVFPHYYNPQKHVIVSQNPDTKEIYSWSDKSGAIYTPEDSQVKNFTWGTTALLLILLFFGSFAYNIIMKQCSRILLTGDDSVTSDNKKKSRESYVPRLQ